MTNDNQSVAVIVRSDEQGHWVVWNYDGATGTLGPYEDAEMAAQVRIAKERELVANNGPLNGAWQEF